MSWLSPLTEAVVQYWGRTGKAYNLARAKPELLKRGVALETHLAGRKLKDAIQEDGAAELRLVRHPTNRLTWGIVPQAVELPVDLAALFIRGAESPLSPEASVRFSRSVWLAFSKPLRPGFRRFLEISNATSSFYDIAEGHSLPPSGLEILPDFIWNPQAELLPPENRDQEIVERVKRWAKEKDVSLDSLTRREERGEHAVVDRRDFSHLDISGLSQSDKARILIPLDLLEKIRFGK